MELKPGIDLLGPVDEIFYDTYDRFVPVNEPSLDNCFISTVSLDHYLFMFDIAVSLTCRIFPYMQSYDATTHFESTVMDVLAMYRMITGKVRIDWFLVVLMVMYFPF